MRIQPIQPASPINKSKPKAVDMAEYKRIKANVEEHQPDAEEWFARVDRFMTKVFPWVMVMVVIYLAVQLSRALTNGWLP